MKKKENIYNQVYDFTNENVTCFKDLYHFENSKVLSVVGSGDYYFSSILNGAKQIDLFDINHTSYLYFILKFYSIRELTYEEFYDFLIKKNINNAKIYIKLEKLLPKEVLNYYKYLINKNRVKTCFKIDGIDLLSKANKIYYFNNTETVIPYFDKNNYYKLQEILKAIKLPIFYNYNFLNLKKHLSEKYDILLLSNIYNSLPIEIKQYTKLLKEYDIPEIQACYDWNGWFLSSFSNNGYSVDRVLPSSPDEYAKQKNYVYSLKK